LHAVYAIGTRDAVTAQKVCLCNQREIARVGSQL
jgi:hypothetical protein